MCSISRTLRAMYSTYNRNAMARTLETVARGSTAALSPRSAAADLSKAIADAIDGHFSEAAATEVDVDGAPSARPNVIATVTMAATKGAAVVGDGRSRQSHSHASL